MECKASELMFSAIEEAYNQLEDVELAQIKNLEVVTRRRHRLGKLRGRVPPKLRKLLRVIMNYKVWLSEEDLFRVILAEKRWALDFLAYVVRNDPRIPYHYFPFSDHPEIKKFVKNKFLLAFFEYLRAENLFDEHDFKRQKAYREFYEGSPIRRKENWYECSGFRSCVNMFEIGVFLEKYGVDLIKSKDRVSGATIIDCGAFVGDTAYIFTKEFSPQNIICIEPDKELYRILETNLKANNLEKTTLVKKAVGDRRGIYSMKLGGTGRALVAETNIPGEQVEVTTIDDIVKEFGVKRVGLIKMDIEGYELPALLGAMMTIKKDSPVLLISIYHKGQDFFEIPLMLKKINQDYQLRFINLYANSPTCERLVLAEAVR